MVMIVGGLGEYVVSSCRHGIAVLNEAAFQVMMCVSWLVSVIGLGMGVWLLDIVGVGCVYSMIDYVYLSASVWVSMGMLHVRFEYLVVWIVDEYDYIMYDGLYLEGILYLCVHEGVESMGVGYLCVFLAG